MIGLGLGIIWSPCVGPTLGAATTLASQSRNLTQIGLLMMIFALDAGTPLVVLGSLSRAAVMRLRGGMMAAGEYGKLIPGGLDKSFEAWAVRVSPDWLTKLTTRF